MKRFALILSAFLVLGCVGRPDIREKFVCPDQWVVDDPLGCGGHGIECEKCKPANDGCDSLVEKPKVTGACGFSKCHQNTTYVGSIKSDVYHVCGCSHVSQIKEENIVCFASEADAIRDGRKPASCVG